MFNPHFPPMDLPLHYDPDTDSFGMRIPSTEHEEAKIVPMNLPTELAGRMRQTYVNTALLPPKDRPQTTPPKNDPFRFLIGDSITGPVFWDMNDARSSRPTALSIISQEEDDMLPFFKRLCAHFEQYDDQFEVYAITPPDEVFAQAAPSTVHVVTPLAMRENDPRISVNKRRVILIATDFWRKNRDAEFDTYISGLMKNTRSTSDIIVFFTGYPSNLHNEVRCALVLGKMSFFVSTIFDLALPNYDNDLAIFCDLPDNWQAMERVPTRNCRYVRPYREN